MYKLLCCLLLVATSATRAFGLTATEILENSDRKIIPASAIFSIDVISYKGDSSRKYSIKGVKKGSENTLLLVESPSSVKDIVHLRQGDNIWTYYPSIGKTIRMAYQAVFMDTTLNYGDIISTELTRDYLATLNGEEKIGNQNVYVLILSPKPGTMGYSKIICRIDKNSFVPVKREYYSLSNVLLKTVRFQDVQFTPELSSLTQVFEEPLKQRKTEVRYTHFDFSSPIQNRVFNPNALSYLKSGNL